MNFADIAIESSRQVEQPIRVLPSWYIIATIFQHLGWQHEIADLLQKLSKRSRIYYLSHHREMLGDFVYTSFRDNFNLHTATTVVLQTEIVLESRSHQWSKPKNWIVYAYNNKANITAVNFTQDIAN